MEKRNLFGLNPLDRAIEEFRQRPIGLSMPQLDRQGQQPEYDTDSRNPAPVRQQQTQQRGAASNMLPPPDLQPLFEKAAARHGVPLEIVMALGQQESSYNPQATGQPTKWGRAMGIMQYLDSTAKGMGINPYDPEQAIDAAAKQIRQRLDKGYSMEDAVKEHFAGPNRQLWGPKTKQYGIDVLSKANQIRSLLGGGGQQSERRFSDLIDSSNPYETVGTMSTREDGPMSIPSGVDVRGLDLRPSEAEKAREAFLSAEMPETEDVPAEASSTADVLLESLKAGSVNVPYFVAYAPEAALRAIEGALEGLDNLGRSLGLPEWMLERKYIGPNDIVEPLVRGKTFGNYRAAGISDIAKMIKGAGDKIENEQHAKVLAGIAKNADDAFAHAIDTGDFGPVIDVLSSPKAWAAAFGQAAPSLAVALIGGLPAIAALEGGAALSEVKEFEEKNGKIGDLNAANAILQTATVNTLLEKLGLDAMLGRLPKQVQQRIVGATIEGAKGRLVRGVTGAAIGGGAEMVTEGLQTVNENLAKRMHYDESQGLSEGVLLGAMGGGVTGGAVGGVSGAMREAETLAGQPTAEPQIDTRGPLTRALNAGEQAAAEARVTVTSTTGQISGFLESYQADGQGGFVARILGDDGLVYNFTHLDGVNIQRQPTGPLALPSPVITVTPDGAAMTTEDRQSVIAAEQAAREEAAQFARDYSYTDDIRRVSTIHAARESLPDTIADGEKAEVMTTTGEIVEGVVQGYQKTQDGPTLVLTTDDGTVINFDADDVLGLSLVDDAPAATDIEPEPSAQNEEQSQADSTSPEPKAEDSAKPIGEMNLTELSERRQYLSEQARLNGGWNKRLLQERDRIEAATEKLLNQGEPRQDDIQARPSDVTTQGGHELVEVFYPRDGINILVRKDHLESGRDKLPAFQKTGARWYGAKSTVKRSALQSPQGESVGAAQQATEGVRTRGHVLVPPQEIPETALANQVADDSTIQEPDEIPDYAFADEAPAAEQPSAQQPETAQEPIAEQEVDQPQDKAKLSSREKALQRIEAGRAWFGTEAKANDFITKNDLGDSHTIEQTGAKRFEVVPRSTVSEAQAPAVAKAEPSQDAAPSAARSGKESAPERKKSAPELLRDEIARRTGMQPTSVTRSQGVTTLVLDPSAATRQPAARKTTRETAAPSAGTHRQMGPNGFTLLSDEQAGKVQSAFAGMEVESLAIGSSTDGFLNFGEQYPDGRFFIESTQEVVGFDGKGGWEVVGDPTKKGKYNVENEPAQEIIRVLSELGAKPRPSAAAEDQGYEQRKTDRINRIEQAQAEEDINSIIQEEYSDPERYMEGGTSDVQAAASNRRQALRSKKHLEDSKRRYESGEWVPVDSRDTFTQLKYAEDDANRRQREDDKHEYRAVEFVMDERSAFDSTRYIVERRLKPTTDSSSDALPSDLNSLFAKNKIFTSDAVEKARARLKKKLNQLNSGIDPEVLMDGMTIAGAYIEAGTRKFSDYAQRMISDLGDGVKPYLLSFWEGARHYPGLDTTGMTSAEESKAAFDKLLNPDDLKNEAVGSVTPKPKARTRKTGKGGDITLTQDWGVEYIDGYSDSPSRETGNSTKDAFLKEARKYLNEVAKVLTERGYSPRTGRNGKPERPVSVNEAGVAVSGDVSLNMLSDDGERGIYASISGTSLRGSVPTTPSGISILYRTTNGNQSGSNNWAPVDLSAIDLANIIDNQFKREKAHAERQANARNTAPSAPRPSAEAVPTDAQQGATGGLFGQSDQGGDGVNQPSDRQDTGRDTEAAGQREAQPTGGNATREYANQGSGRSGDSRGAGADTSGAAGRAKRGSEPVRADGRLAERKQKPVSSPTNYRIADGEIAREGSWKATAERNVEIVELIKRLKSENRMATPEEKAKLVKFTGWGASEIANGVFPDRYGRFKDGWDGLGTRLKEALTEDEYANARRSTQYAHYTSESVIRSIYNGLSRLGFKGGQVLEPGMGTGLFNGLMPDDMANNTTYTGVEFDQITGEIAKQLYPASNVIIGDYSKTSLPKGYFDAAIGNPPFASITVTNDPEYRRHRFMLHDYFFAKTIDRVRDGGLLVFVTSKGTMDKRNDKARRYLSERANLLGAIRLPQTAFKDNAGTEVVTDVLFLQKRGEGVEDNGASWGGLKEVKTKGGEITHVNEYFADHPEMVLGDHALTGSMYRANEYTVVPKDGQDIEQLFSQAIQNLPESVYNPTRNSQSERAAVIDRDFNPSNKKEGGLYVSDDGVLMQVESGAGVEAKQRIGSSGKPISLKPREIEWLKGYVGVRDALKQAQFDQLNDGDWESSLKALNKAYDAFTKKHGPILAHTVTERENADGTITETKRFKNKPLWEMDAEGALVYALETINNDGSISKAPVLLGRVLSRPAEPEIKTTQDALFVSLNQLGRLDIDDVARLAKQTREEVVEALGDSVYESPDGQWQTADQYLSGNVVRKLEEARAAADLNPRFKRNVEALLAVQPAPLGPNDIVVRLGTNWVPEGDIKAFAQEVLGENMEVSYKPQIGHWEVNGSKYNRTSEWAGGDLAPSEILSSVLNSRQIKVTYRDHEGKTHTDPVKTEAANAVAAKMRAEFQRWIWRDKERSDRLVNYYNETFNNIVPRQYDGSHLTLPGVSLRFKLHPHQKRAVWRSIQDGDTYLAHAVGAGKAQPLDAKILTPTGWVRMGEIQPGMQVITQTGEPTLVEEIFPQGEKEIFRVVFSDGSSTECCDEHLWLTQTYAERNAESAGIRKGKDWPSGRPKVRQLSEIRETLEAPHLGAKNHSIPLVAPVEFPEKPIPLDPYLLGVLLGDGHIGEKSISISGTDKEVIYGIALPDGVRLRENLSDGRCPSWHIVGSRWHDNPVLTACRSLGLSGKLSHEKFIPTEYLWNNASVRLAVLRGLMDADGSVEKGGHSLTFYTVSERLADDVTFLVRSLGGITTQRTKKTSYTHGGERLNGREAYRLTISMPPAINPFFISRKADKVVPKTKYAPSRYIVSVEPIGKKPAQCIRVAHQSHLYVTDDFIVTHNTFTMIASGMEQRRLGLIQKPMYVVPNHMLAQFSREFLELYPTANIMVADEQNFHTSNRRRFMAQAALNDPDAVIITHSAFSRLGMGEEYASRFIQKQITEWREALEEVGNSDRFTKKQIENRIEQLERRLEGKQTAKDQVLNFEEMGIDYLFVDEFHEFRKLDFATNQSNIKGIDPQGSQRSLDLYMKVQYLREKKPNRSLTAASGTPITNTMGELFTVQRFFQLRQLEEDGLASFDAWSAQYGDTVTALEQNAAGGYEAVTRFAKFQNVPELMRRVRTFMDILTSSNLGALVQRPDVIGGGREIVVTPQPDGYREYQKKLEERIKAIRNRKGPPQKGDDIILNVISDGRFSAIDMRFVDPEAKPDPNSKLNKMLDDVIEHYYQTADNVYTTNGVEDPIKGSSIIIFTDIGLGEQAAEKRGFNMREWIERRLTDAGIPAQHIAFMRDYKQHAKKERLFADMREGKKRILIGSKDMETGTNVQKRLTFLAHLDAPWFPASIEQREGRIIRQGNQNPEVTIKAYATKGSYDSTMWGMNSRKARFIEQAMNGDFSVRNLEDVSEASSFEMASALASGDERYLKLAGLRGDVERLNRLKLAHYDDQNKLRREKGWAESRIERLNSLVAELDAAIAKRKPIKAGEFAAKVGNTTFDSRDEFSVVLFEEFKKRISKQEKGPQVIGQIGGFDILFDAHGESQLYVADVTVDLPSSEAILVYPLDPDLAVKGLATKAANQVNGLDRKRQEFTAEIETLSGKIRQIESRQGTPFAEEADLIEKQAELNALEAELAAEAEVESQAEQDSANAASETDTANSPDQEVSPSSPEQDGKQSGSFSAGSTESALQSQKPIVIRSNAADRALGTSALRDKVFVGLRSAKEFHNDAIGTIKLSRKGWSKSRANAADRAKLLATPQLDRIIRNGVYLGSKPAKGKGGIEAYHYIGHRAVIDGVPLIVVATMEQNANGDVSYYNHATHDDVFSNGGTREQVDSLLAAYRRPLYSARGNLSRGDTLPIKHSRVESALRSGPLGGIVDKLIGEGHLTLHPHDDTLPTTVVERGPVIQGYTDPSGHIHLVTENLTPQTAMPVLLHEVFHAHGEKLIGTKKWNNLLRQLDGFYAGALRRQSEGRVNENDFWDGALKRVQDAKAKGLIENGREAEEFGAYAIENYELAPNGIKKWIDNIIGAIKDFLARRFNIQLGDITPAQLRAFAVAALREKQGTFPAPDNTLGGSALGSGLFSANSDQNFTSKDKTESLNAALKFLDEYESPIRGDYVGNAIRDMDGAMGLYQRFAVHPYTIASMYPEFTPVFNTAVAQSQSRNQIIEDLHEYYRDYQDLPQASKDKVNKVMELGRLMSQVYSVEHLQDGVTNTGSLSAVEVTENGPQRVNKPIKAGLTEVGEVVSLNKDEIRAYQSMRKMYDSALDMFRDQFLRDMGLEQYIGVADASKALMEAASKFPKAAPERSRLENMAGFVADIEQSKRTGYVPFTRYGDYVVAVKERLHDIRYREDGDGYFYATNVPEDLHADLDNMGAYYDHDEGAWRLTEDQRDDLEGLNEQTIYSEKVETGVRDMWGRNSEKNVKKNQRPVDQIPSVKKAIDRILKDEVGGNPNRRIVAFPTTKKRNEQGIDLSSLDALAEVAMLDQATWDSVREELAKALQAGGFRRHFFQSTNVPGYSLDFERSSADYIVGISGYLARRQHSADWDKHIGAIKGEKLHQYATKFRAYSNEPSEEYALLRQTGFFMYIAGNISSAVLNATQVPMMTMPFFNQITSSPQAVREMAKAYKDALSMLDHKAGLDMFDFTKAPADISEALNRAKDEGLLLPLQSLEVMGVANRRSVEGRRYQKVYDRTVQAVAFPFTATERLNRIVTFIAAHRLAQKTGTNKKIRDVFKNNPMAKAMLGRGEADPYGFAEFAVAETQFTMGKINRPAMMRNVGAPILQFKSFMLQFLETVFMRWPALQGKKGKKARNLALLTMMLMAGVWGFPGAEDLRELIEKFYKGVTKKDFDTRDWLRRTVYDVTGSMWLTRLVDSGGFAAGVQVGDNHYGIDMSQRVGMGRIMPETQETIGVSWLDTALAFGGIPVDMGIGRPVRFATQLGREDVGGAVTQLMPNFVENARRSHEWTTKGVLTRSQNKMLNPEDVDTFSVVAKSIGFQPVQISELYAAQSAQRRAQSAVSELRRHLQSKLARAMAAAARADDPERREQLEQEVQDVFGEIMTHNQSVTNPEDMIEITNSNLNRLLERELFGSTSRYGREGKAAASAASRREAYGQDRYMP